VEFRGIPGNGIPASNLTGNWWKTDGLCSTIPLDLHFDTGQPWASSVQGRRHKFEGWGVNALEVGGVNTVKTLKYEKGGGCMTPLASMVALPLP